MRSKTFAAAVLIASVAGMSGNAAAQDKPAAEVKSNEVTFQVPVNLTRLSPSISRVAVTCTLFDRTGGPTGLTARVELAVSAGQVVHDTTVVVDASRSDFKPGNTVLYECALTGLSTATGTSAGGWRAFDGKGDAAYAVSPIPVPIKSSLVW